MDGASVLKMTRMAGFVGAALAGAAYIPQIRHLVRVRCSAGISRAAFRVWLVATLLVTSHAVVSGAAVFVLLGALQLVAISVILVYAGKYRDSYCDGHLPPGRPAAMTVGSSTSSGPILSSQTVLSRR